MISYYTIFTVVIIHWLADFFFQTDEMSKGKSTSNKVLRDHIWVYWIGLVLIAVLNLNLFHPENGSTAAAIWATTWCLINAVAHFFTDYVTSRASSLLWKDGNVHDFFVVIGIDQAIHMLTLFGTLIYFTK